MALAPGSKIASYHVLAKLGEGGMGEVYRARDTKLNRDVAIKVLPPSFAGDPERVARFTREAQTLAALNHQNIAHVYDAGKTTETTPEVVFLAMELVAGEVGTPRLIGLPPDAARVRARLRHGASAAGRGGGAPRDLMNSGLLLADVLSIARQIADGLEAAHEQGIIHRDLKPANIKIRPDGVVKVLDFGLAKVAAGSEDVGSIPSNSPTLTARATQAGIILGTAAYMSPEQAKGRAVDKRADIWAFGVVLHEMLTGQRLFEGETIPETLGLIFSREIDAAALPADTPAALRNLIARCLVKDPKRRLRDIGDARLQIEDLIAGSKDPASGSSLGARYPEAGSSDPAKTTHRPAWQWLSFAVLLAATAGIAGWIAKPGAAPSPSIRLSISLPPGWQVTSVPAITDDGRTIAYAAGRTPASSHLYLRSLDDDAPRQVMNSPAAQYPFFSPDGRTIAFFAGGKLRSASAAGGAARDVANAAASYGGTFDHDGRIVYAPSLGAGLWRVAAENGKPEQLTKPDGAGAGYAHVYPQRLSGTRDLLFAFWGQTFYSALLSLDTATWREATPPTGLNSGVSVYVPGGYLAAHDGAGTVTAFRWAPQTTAPASPTPVINRVVWALGAERSWLAVSESGTAVYVPGSPAERRLVWVDRRGEATAIPGDPEVITNASLSRDGKRILYGSLKAQFIVDVASGARTRLISEFRSWTGGWLPGDDRVVFSSNKDGDWDLYTISVSGSDIKPLLKKPFAQHVQAVANDGTIIYTERHPATGSDLWTLAPNGTAAPLAVTPFNETAATVSPDGRYVAYVSDASGRDEVVVRSIAGTGDPVMISVNGGTGPCWSRDGLELFYRAGDDLVSVEVQTRGALVLGARKRLIDLSAYDSAYFHEFDVSADGHRFLLIRTEPDARPYRLNIITNWVDELRRKLQ